MIIVIILCISWFLLFLVIMRTWTNARLYIYSLDSGVIAALLFGIIYLSIAAFAPSALSSTAAPIVPILTCLLASIIIWRAKSFVSRLYIRFHSTNIEVANKEIEEISRWEIEEYDDQTINTDGLKLWYQTYNLGSYIFCDQSDTNMIGVMSFWPITQDCFKGLKAGVIDEKNITPKFIDSAPNPNHMTYWYIGDIYLKKRYRGRSMGVKLMKDALKAWYEYFRPNSSVVFCASAASEDGLTMLQRSGFDTNFCIECKCLKCNNNNRLHIEKKSCPKCNVGTFFWKELPTNAHLIRFLDVLNKTIDTIPVSIPVLFAMRKGKRRNKRLDDPGNKDRCE